MSDVNYAEKLPPECPPGDARIPENGETYYRLVKGSPAQSGDFDSHAKKGLAGRFAQVDSCQLSACSIWDSVEGAKKIRRDPASKIAKVTLNATAGKIKKTFSAGHHSWWVARDFDPCAHSSIVSESPK